MSAIQKLICSLKQKNPSFLLEICEELIESISFRAYNATYINEEGVFALTRQLKNVENSCLSLSNRKDILKISGTDDILISQLFREPEKQGIRRSQK